jgi:predicted GH43/DUF377 family glycosyl hydrolase
MKPLENSAWENYKIGLGGPLIKTSFGWIMIYHGVSKEKNLKGNGRYSLGIALLSLDLKKVLYRQKEPILTPTETYECQGYVPDIVFSCGHVIKNGDLIVYYGAADTCIGASSINYQYLLNTLERKLSYETLESTP